MTEFELLGPSAHGAPCGQAVLKATAEDFQVNEVLDIPLSGAGEHLWLWVEKRQLNTEEAARHLSKTLDVPLRAISYAGLKDRQALTRQWFSLHLPGKSDPDWSKAETDRLRILQATRHSRKLQRGAHTANGFILRLTQCTASPSDVTARCQQLQRHGVPNYFGTQRFGFDGGNLSEALRYAEAKELPVQRALRSRLLSAGRSYLFNQILAQRVTEGTWDQAIPGDLLSFTDSRSFFAADGVVECTDPRLEALDVHPTGPLWGEGDVETAGAIHTLESSLLEKHKALCLWLAQAKLKQERRILRLPIQALTWHYPESDILQLNFVLPTGCFATVVVRELVSLAGPTDISCAF